MIAPEHDPTMLVTMTAGDLYAIMQKAAEEAAQKAVGDILRYIASTDKREADTELIVGGENIAKVLGVDRSTFYKLRREGRFGDAVHYMGTRLVARRSELLNAITEE